jgi:hypothetical protein
MSLRFGRYIHLILATGLTLTITLTCALADDQKWKKSAWLATEHLQEVGLHLPSNIPAVRDLFKSQVHLATHQEFTVRWDSIPGHTELVRWEEAAKIPLSSDFVLLERRRNVPSAPGNQDDNLGRDLVIVAVDANGQVLGLNVQDDGRVIRGEHFAPGVNMVRPSVVIDFLLPDDPEIKSVIFFRPTKREEGGRKLVRIGAIDLQASGH